MAKEKAPMAKDRSEKYLEAYPDVFEDIVNAYIFKSPVIRQEDLMDGPTEAVYKAEDGLSLQENRRDVSKYVRSYNTIISLIGIENQTDTDSDMVFRVMGYDYTSYLGQIKKGKKRYPVITVVLYFGDKPWNEVTSLRDAVECTEFWKEYIPDYQIKVIDIPRTPQEIRAQLKSDFAVVVDYFVNRKNPNYKPSEQELVHAEAVLKILEVFGDRKFKTIETDLIEWTKKGEKITMCEYIDRIYNEGMELGIEQGRALEIIETAEEYKLSIEDIVERLVMKLNITKDQAIKYIEIYNEQVMTSV